MRQYKNIEKKIDTTVVVTQPDMSFTPRQILEQFARNEVVASYYDSSDAIDDSNFTEDELVNDVIEFEDAIDAENHLLENQYALQFEKNQGQSSVSERSPQGTDTSERGTGTETGANE